MLHLLQRKNSLGWALKKDRYESTHICLFCVILQQAVTHQYFVKNTLKAATLGVFLWYTSYCFGFHLALISGRTIKTHPWTHFAKREIVLYGILFVAVIWGKRHALHPSFFVQRVSLCYTYLCVRSFLCETKIPLPLAVGGVFLWYTISVSINGWNSMLTSSKAVSPWSLITA